jgi:hypothetical protein
MIRRIAVFLPLILLSACGDLRNPFAKEKPFLPTAVPPDFALVIAENHLTYVNRNQIQQVITAADGKSRTTYSTYRDFGDRITEQFTQDTTLTPGQIQAMWNAVASNNLMEDEPLWINWLSDTDLHLRNSLVLQIHANGKSRTYQEVNGTPYSLQSLMLLVNQVRLPTTQGSNTPVVAPDSPPSTPPAAPATRP